MFRRFLVTSSSNPRSQPLLVLRLLSQQTRVTTRTTPPCAFYSSTSKTQPPPFAKITTHDKASNLKFRELQELQSQIAMYRMDGNLKDAAECADYAIEQMRAHYGGAHVGLASVLCSRGVIAKDQGDLDLAMSFYEQSIQVYDETKEHFAGKTVALQNLGNALREKAKQAAEDAGGAEALFDRAHDALFQAAEMLRKGEGPSAQYAEALRKLGNLHKDRGNFAEAEKMLTEAMELADLRTKEKHPLRFSCRNDLAMVLKLAGKDFDRARALYQTAIEFAQDNLGVKSRDFIVYTHNLAELLETREETKQEALQMRHFLLKLR